MKRRKFIENIAGLGAVCILTPHDLMSQSNTGEKQWHIEQFKDKGLAHFSYAILVGSEIIVIDPERNPQKYYDFARANNAKITGVIETHPHADFISSHLEIHRSLKAKIYTSGITRPAYPFDPLNDGQVIKVSGQITLRAIDSPGHAPDHIAIVLNEGGKDVAVFSGDALLIGDVGRPDLRDNNTSVESQRTTLAAKMYHTVHDKFGKLNDNVIIYPAHGAGSLCGKAIRDASSSTIGYEKETNYAFKIKDKEEFIKMIVSDLPFIPKYFPYNVKLNIKGAPDLQPGISAVKILHRNYRPQTNALIIDGRPSAEFKRSYLTGAVNIQDGSRFETWLGSIVAPGTKFYLTAENEDNLRSLIAKTSKIGYEFNIEGAFVYDAADGEKFAQFDEQNFNPDDGKYTIIDVRTEREVKDEKIFKNSINIPLQDLDSRISEIPTDKPILVNCASGYRSAAGSSLLKKYLPEKNILDLGAAVTKYEEKKH
jgi:hydroxyacylglutathione hydrolase